ncbi:hypothetical protein GQ43DRAFT_439830 [Delitschia confertaspora ATCC 74209]|uniref:GST N-terminal domain-containing protein n=1 Tax=Delitschia confertaspora ATCC 74209 TaxID=1513339 RepID=A0A9P4MT92_9PLEO|nr:hypothetical protein GQ43DRAFT_439830 [Delitschia confertaspora ATCC 74209]
MPGSFLLCITSTSPFARKCRIAISFLNLSSQISWLKINPWKSSTLRTSNPLCKVPTLLRPDGKPALYDSGVIIEYLDFLSQSQTSRESKRMLIPPSGEARWRALRLQALCDDACSAAGRLYAASQNPSSLDVSQSSKDRLNTAVQFSLDALEKEDLNSEDWDLGDLCAVILPSYCEFRVPHAHINWRDTRPKLAKFVYEMEAKEEFRTNRFSHE